MELFLHPGDLLDTILNLNNNDVTVLGVIKPGFFGVTEKLESLLSLELGHVPALLDPLWKSAAAPYKALDHPRPDARKSSLTQGKLTSPAVSSIHILDTVQKEERKSIFIKGWQRYVKEYCILLLVISSSTSKVGLDSSFSTASTKFGFASHFVTTLRQKLCLTMFFQGDCGSVGQSGLMQLAGKTVLGIV